MGAKSTLAPFPIRAAEALPQRAGVAWTVQAARARKLSRAHPTPSLLARVQIAIKLRWVTSSSQRLAFFTSPPPFACRPAPARDVLPLRAAQGRHQGVHQDPV